MNLKDPVTNINFIGEKYKKKLKRLDIETVEDLLRHYPSRYKDYSQTEKIAKLVAGEKTTIHTEILEIKNVFTRRGKKLTKAIVRDNSGTLLLVWFNQHYLTNTLKEGEWYYFSGKLEQFSGQPAFLSPEYESAGQPVSETASQPDSKTNLQQKGEQADEPIHTARLVPIYPETQGVSSKWLRSRINAALKYFANQEIPDPLPDKIREDFKLAQLKNALYTIHFPQNQEEAKKARRRFAFEEMFFFQLQVMEKQREWENRQTAYRLPHTAKPKKKKAEYGTRNAVSQLVKSLPFKLTTAQKRCTKEIQADLEKNVPMNRLLQGDVGSGKTIVAVVAAYVTALDGYQTAYMAPTEILAQQIYRTFKKYLDPFKVTLSLQTGSTQQSAVRNPPTAEKETRDAESGKRKADIIIGTHALLHRTEIFEKLALVIIDEQHRFGVKQRAKLVKKKEVASFSSRSEKKRGLKSATHKKKDGATPHTLTMTATPIPRSMALTIYGHLDISTIDEMPPGVKPTKTWLIPEKKREAGYDWIGEKLDEPFKKVQPHSPTYPRKDLRGQRNSDPGGRGIGEVSPGTENLTNQCFIICPLIEESEHETLEDVKAVTTEYERLKKIFSDFNIGLLHGRMKNEEKEKILKNFRDGKTQILVSTPVVEVGIDIPQANIMVIEGAHRFGLASLHQLRGRVGRAGQDSYCLLFTPKKSAKIRKRLKALEQYNSGLNLAELDLKIRGPGELYGTKQHGVPDFKLASLSDIDLIKATRAAAGEIIAELEDYPELEKHLENKNIAPN